MCIRHGAAANVHVVCGEVPTVAQPTKWMPEPTYFMGCLIESVCLYQLSKAAGGTTARTNVQKLTKTLHSPCSHKMGGFQGNSVVRGNCVAGSNPAPGIWICGGIRRIASSHMGEQAERRVPFVQARELAWLPYMGASPMSAHFICQE